MTNISEKQNKLNNAFLIKSRKIISILVVFFLVMTIMDSVTSAGNIKTEKSIDDDIKDIDLTENTENQVNNIEDINFTEDTNNQINNSIIIDWYY